MTIGRATLATAAIPGSVCCPLVIVIKWNEAKG